MDHQSLGLHETPLSEIIEDHRTDEDTQRRMGVSLSHEGG